MKEFKNILVVRTDRIGDVVLTTPAIKALKVAYPSSKLTVLVAKATRELVEGNPFIDEVITDDRQHANQGMVGFFKLVAEVRKRKFDLAVNFHTKKRTNLLCYLAGIPHRVGYKDNKHGFLLNDPIPDARWDGIKHESELCMDVVCHLGVDAQELKPMVPADDMWENWIERLYELNQFSPDDDLVAFHLGASDPSKRWPVHKFADLIRMIRSAYGCKCVLIGAQDTIPLGQSLNTILDNSVLDLSGRTTLGQLVSLLKHCKLLVSNDSGPVHVADALGTPVISIFTRNIPGINPGRWRPLSEKSRVIAVPEGSEASFKKAGSASAEYLELIDVKEVFDSVDQVFKLC